MGVIRVEGSNRLYFRYKDGRGKWVRRPSPYTVGQEALAEAAFKTAMKAIEGGGRGGRRRHRRGHAAHLRRALVREARGGRGGGRPERAHQPRAAHLSPPRDLRFHEFRPQDLKPLIGTLEKKLRAPRSKAERTGEVPVTETLSTRSVRHILETLRALFTAAHAEGLVQANPVVLRRGLLPAKRDRKINRARHRFVVGEIKQLISDPRIAPDRRVVYALLFLTGLRPEELVPLTWRDLEAREPFDCLGVTKAYNRTFKRVVFHTKTGVDREVPVHPTLRAILAAWRLGGWAEFYGRHPKLDDLIVPSLRRTPKAMTLGMRGLSLMNERIKEDVERIRLPLNGRYLYCTRRSFISMARAKGIHKDDLQWVPHGVRKDVMDDYTTPEWEHLCSLVQKLEVKLIEGKVVELPRAASSGSEHAPEVKNPGKAPGPTLRNCSNQAIHSSQCSSHARHVK